MNRRDFLSWAALSAAIIVTAYSEYQLGVHVGFGPYISAGIPAALDIYALRALRANRDVLAVVVSMIVVNAASHLVTTGMLPVSVPLVVAVSAIAPLVLWRVHSLAGEHDHTAAVLDEPDTQPQVQTQTHVEIERVTEPVTEAVSEPVPLPPCPTDTTTVIEHAKTVVAADTRTRRRVSATVSDKAANPSDIEALTAKARTDFEGRVPSFRELMNTYSIGQSKARRIREQLEEAQA